jgi:hypothetical protein
MSDLFDITRNLQDTNAMIAQLERDLASYPHMPALLLNLKSLEKRRRMLETEFAAAAERSEIDICSYRIISDEDRPKLSGLTAALSEFQNTISVFYDAIKNGPKQVGRVSSEVVTETSLDFAYTFAGSVGFVLSVPSERFLFPEQETNLEASIGEIFEVAKATKPETILGFARRLGRAPIRLLYKWADTHARSMFSADVQWKHGQTVKKSLLIQRQEFEVLRKTIEATSEEQRVDVIVTGVLVGADATRRTFHLQPDSGGDIRGAFVPGTISDSHTVELPKRYQAHLTKTTLVHYSTEEEESHYLLVQLEPA